MEALLYSILFNTNKQYKMQSALNFIYHPNYGYKRMQLMVEWWCFSTGGNGQEKAAQ